MPPALTERRLATERETLYARLRRRAIWIMSAGMKTTLLLLITLAAPVALPAGAVPKVGDQAPDFSAAASDGTTVTLSDLVGQGNIVLYFYPKDDTPGCTKDACGLRDSITDLKGLNAIVLGVSFDSVESHKKFIEKYNLPFRLLADTDKKVAKAYGIADDHTPLAPRVTFIIGKDGKIAYVNPKVNPAAHAAEIRAALAGLKP
jgi:peroxiredoxin Q/BCP